MNKLSMNQQARHSRFAWPAIGVVIAVVALGGCQRHDTETAANPSSSAGTTATQAERRAGDTAADVHSTAESAGDRARAMAQEANRDVRQAANTVGDKVADAVITTTVNGELTKDSALSALKINVDTSNGNVSLRGTAPDAAARERATQLAAGVKGVTNVDNQLQIASAH